MRMNTRHSELLALLEKAKKMEVSALADQLAVSQVTIRKDLDYLEEQGFVRREHGYAVLQETPVAAPVAPPQTPTQTINQQSEERTMMSTPEMRAPQAASPEQHDTLGGDTAERIVSMAADSVQDGDSIMIESGPCCALLADRLAASKQNITVITNSVSIASRIGQASNVRLILLGGNFEPEARVLVGAITRKCVQEFFVDKLFLDSEGYHERIGFTGRDHIRAETVQDMAEQAGQVIVMAESDRLKKHGTVRLLPASRVTRLYTDAGISAAMEQRLSDQGVDIVKA